MGAWRIAVCKTSPAPLSATILSDACGSRRSASTIVRIVAAQLPRKKGGDIHTGGQESDIVDEMRRRRDFTLHHERTII